MPSVTREAHEDVRDWGDSCRHKCSEQNIHSQDNGS
jgi:hypothetical protein